MPEPPQFRTICRIGHWLHVDAMWGTENDLGYTINYVQLQLVGAYGETLHIGSSIITTDYTGAVVTDEDGRQFPDLEDAIRCHAGRLLEITWQWTGWQSWPPAHLSREGMGVTTIAFSRHEIATLIPQTEIRE